MGSNPTLKNSDDRTEKYMDFKGMIDTLKEKIENRNTTGESIPYEDILKITDILKERFGQETEFTTLIKDGRVYKSVNEFMYNFQSIYQIVAQLPHTQETIACLKRLGDMWHDVDAVHKLTKHCMTLYPLVEDENSKHSKLMQLFTRTLRNCTGYSHNFRVDVCCAPGFLEFLHTNLSYMSTAENAAKDKGRLPIHYDFTVIVNNCCVVKNNITLFRKFDFQAVFGKLLHHECFDMRISVVQCLSKIMNEEESKMFQTNVDIISNWINFLSQAVNSPLRRAETTGPLAASYGATVVAKTLTRLAKNDPTKRVLVEQGLLPVLVRFVDTGDTARQREGARIFIALAFDKQNQDDIVKDKSALECLLKLEKSEDEQTRTDAQRTLWLLKDKRLKVEEYRTVAEVETFPSHSSHHLMISYQSENREILIKVKGVLEANNFRVWMDVFDMGGEVLSAMAEAVENAKAVLICYSSKYKESDFCRMEATYAKQKRKKLFFLKMEELYDPDGWLGFLIGDNYFYDLSGKYKFEDKLTQLLKWIRKEQATVGDMQIQQGNLVHGTDVVTSSVTTGVAKSNIKAKLEEVEGWTSNQVGEWLEKNQIPRTSLGELNGMNIVLLYQVQQQARLNASFNKIVTDLLNTNNKLARTGAMSQFSRALERLAHTE